MIKLETIYASSNTIEGLKECISKFYCGSQFSINDAGEVYNSNGQLLSTKVVKQGKRYKFGV